MTERSRWLALYVLCVGMLMIVLDATIVNVALPSIKDDLGFSQADLAWVVNAYLIAFGGLLLLAGRLGDLIGNRRVFLVGLAVFTGASLLCAVAQTQGMLIGARFIQGVGGALTSAVILGMVVTMFPEPREQAKAIGIYTFVAVSGSTIGLLLGGVLTEAINWHWIFFVNLPIGVATALFALRYVPDNDGIGLERGADIPGALLLTVGLMIGVYNILEIPEVGWAATQTIVLGAVSTALVVGVHPAPGADREPADAAAPVPLAQRLRRQRRAGADGRRHVRDLLPRRPLPAGDPRLRRVRGRARLPARLARDGGDVLPLHRAAEHALRSEDDDAPRDLPGRRRDGPLRAHPGRRELLGRRLPLDADLRPRRRARLPVADDAGDVGRHPRGLRARLRASSTRASRWAARSASRSSRPWPASAPSSLEAAGKSTAEALNGGYHLAYIVGAALVLVALGVAGWILEEPEGNGHAAPEDEAEQVSAREPAYSEA